MRGPVLNSNHKRSFREPVQRLRPCRCVCRSCFPASAPVTAHTAQFHLLSACSCLPHVLLLPLIDCTPCPTLPLCSYYPLIVLPELLQQLISLWPALLHKIGYAESYKLRGWRTATWSWVTRAFPHPDDSSATPAAAENGQACKPAGAGPGAACAASDCTASVHDDVMKKAGSTEPSTPSPGSSTC